jgi:hypothetical protein
MKVAKKICSFSIGLLILLVTGTLSPCFATDQEVLVTEVDIKPETLNLKISHGKPVITCFVEAPEGYDAEDIIADSVVISAVGGNSLDPKIEPVRSNIKDSDEDGVNELMLKYSRSELQSAIILYNLSGQVEIVVEGTLSGTEPLPVFAGSDTIRVKVPKE